MNPRKSRNPGRLESRQTVGGGGGGRAAPGLTWNVREEELTNGPRRGLTRGPAGALCDVLLPRRPVDVPHHALHHPLDAFVHAVAGTNRRKEVA